VRADGLLAISEIDLPYLLPTEWLNRHLISAQYEAGLHPNEIKTWRLWATSPQKGGLSAFPLPAKSEQRLWNMDEAFFRARSAAVPQRKFANRQFICTDRNWDRDIWNHWRKTESDEGVRVWVDIGWAVVSSWSSPWERITRYEVQQYGRKNFHRLDAGDVPATWLHELRNLMCIRTIAEMRACRHICFEEHRIHSPCLTWSPSSMTVGTCRVANAFWTSWEYVRSRRMHRNCSTACVLFRKLATRRLDPSETSTGQSSEFCRGCLEIAQRRSGTHSRQSPLSAQRAVGSGVDSVFAKTPVPSLVYQSCIRTFEM
jgi:hypothetical protein